MASVRIQTLEKEEEEEEEEEEEVSSQCPTSIAMFWQV